MNSIVIVVVPEGANRAELERALRRLRLAGEDGDRHEPPGQTEPSDADALPLWTWFLPNPCR